MKKIIPFFSYLLHPIITPVMAALLYFRNTYIFFRPLDIMVSMGQIVITTLFLPITIFFLLKSLRVIRSSVMVEHTRERILPFVFNIGLLVFLKDYVLKNGQLFEFKIYLWGCIYSYVLLLLGILFKKKYSVHISALAGCWMFYILLSVQLFAPNIVGIIILTLLLGATATSRLYLQAHTSKEIIIGFLIGTLPQFIFWKTQGF